MKNVSRLEILLRLGSKCIDCGESDYDVLHVDHKEGNGYLERLWFKENKQDMFETYLQDFDYEKQYLEIRCANCNYRKRIKNQEVRSRITFKNIVEEFNLSLDNFTPELMHEIFHKYPIIRQTLTRQTKSILELIQQTIQEKRKVTRQ